MTKRLQTSEAHVFSSSCCSVLSWLLDVSDIQRLTSANKTTAALRPVFRQALHSPARRVHVLRQRMLKFDGPMRHDDVQISDAVMLKHYKGIRPCYTCATGLSPPETGLVCLECEYKTPPILRSRTVIPDHHIACSMPLKLLVIANEFKASLTAQQAAFMVRGIMQTRDDPAAAILEHVPMLTIEAAFAAIDNILWYDNGFCRKGSLRAALAVYYRIADWGDDESDKTNKYGDRRLKYDSFNRNAKHFDIAGQYRDRYLASAPTGSKFIKYWTSIAERNAFTRQHLPA